MSNSFLFKCPFTAQIRQTDKLSPPLTIYIFCPDPSFSILSPFTRQMQFSDGFQFKVPQAQGPGVWDMNRWHGARIVESRQQLASDWSLIQDAGLWLAQTAPNVRSRWQEIRRRGQVATRGWRSHWGHLSTSEYFVFCYSISQLTGKVCR